MKGYSFFATILLLAATVFHPVLESAEHKTGISWSTNYEKALQESKATSKPILLFFTGSDWCGWCKKLEKEVFDTPEFTQSIGDKMIFVVLDYPMKKSLDSKTYEQNQRLKKHYSIKSYPTVILINGNEDLIGSTGYRSGGGKKYAQHLMKMTQDFTAYKQKMNRLALGNYSGKELKRLFQKAHELGLEPDAEQLVLLGINSDLSHFFLAERYRSLIKNNAMHSEEAAVIKQRLLASDPNNEHLTHYQVAVAEFEALSEELESKKVNTDIAVSPLIKYVTQFQEQDTDNVWRLHMVISQVYLEKNQLDKALKYAEFSYQNAPASIQPEISQAVNKIQSQISEVN